MILLPLLSLKSYAQADNDTIPLRGVNHKSDTTIVISIDYIRQANKKLIERLYLIDVNDKKDSIINYQKLYIDEQNNDIIKFKNRINAYNTYNDDLKNQLNTEKTKIKVCKFTVIISVILSALCIIK